MWEDNDNSDMNDKRSVATEAKSGILYRFHIYPFRNKAGGKFSLYLQLHFL